ncbi:MAG: twin-arginine translocation signal domain-containing protein [Chloroflexota bacterium]
MKSTDHAISRRHFLRLSLMGGGGLILAACGANQVATTEESAASTTTETSEVEENPNQGSVLIGDVLDHALTSDEWAGSFGFVLFRLHEGRVDGEPVYYIRTDASDPDYARENGLVSVPLLANGADIASSIYHFTNSDQLSVLSSAPHHDNFASLFHVKNVTLNDDSLVLESAEAVEQAIADGNASVEETNIFVNHPVVQWPGGSLSVDTEQDSYLGTGQLLEPINLDEMTVKFKLHECFPSSRYIVTDTSAAPMAPMMSISASPPTQALVENEGTDEIWVFANGLEGSGVMGFQPAIFDNQAGSPTWSPFWDHFTVSWTNEEDARVLTRSNEIRDLIESGELTLFNGVPDSHPNGFVVNCPVPVIAANQFSA